MKLTDFCIIFAGLFICLFLGRDLKLQEYTASRLSELAYNRQLDRISEDALMDMTETQWEDGSLLVRVDEVEERYQELYALALDLSDDDAALRGREALIIQQFRQYPYAITSEEISEAITELNVQLLRQKQDRLQEQLLRINMPYISQDRWYQSMSGPQLFTVFEPRKMIWGTKRVVFSGSRIIKFNS